MLLLMDDMLVLHVSNCFFFWWVILKYHIFLWVWYLTHKTLGSINVTLDSNNITFDGDNC